MLVREVVGVVGGFTRDKSFVAWRSATVSCSTCLITVFITVTHPDPLSSAHTY